MAMMSPRAILAFDFGTKNIGVAACYLETAHIADTRSELPPIKAKEGIPDWQEILKLIQQWQPETVLVGLPLASDGSDMEITRRARKFGNRIKGMFQQELVFVDETLSTKAAKQEAQVRGKSKHYAANPVDSIAARLILETWLGQRAVQVNKQ